MLQIAQVLLSKHVPSTTLHKLPAIILSGMEKKPHDPLKFAVIGCGRIGQRHIKHINSVGELSAIVDTDTNLLRMVAAGKNVEQFSSLQEFLFHAPEIDVVSICTPNSYHAAQSVACLQAGYHVVCEKPMALTLPDCHAMDLAAKAANKQLFIIKQNRYNVPVQHVKKMIDEGFLGRILSVQVNCFWNRDEQYYANSWKGSLDVDGGTLFTQFSHFIDLMLWLAGDIIEVQAFMENLHHKKLIEFEDTGVAIFKFANGALGGLHYTVNAYNKNMEGSITVMGEKGTIKVGGEYLNELEYQVLEDDQENLVSLGNKPIHFGSYQGNMSNHLLAYQNVVDVLNGDASITTSVSEAIKTIEVINKIYASAKYHYGRTDIS